MSDAHSARGAVYPDLAIEVTDLRKTYRGTAKSPPKEALKGVSLSIPRGSIYGLLGPNGAGKSTFINILAGLVNKTSGTAKVWGIDIDVDSRSARAAIGVVPQELNLDPFFTPRELLDLQGGLYGVPKAERQTTRLLEAVGLADKADAYSRTLSGGMRRRLMVAKAMVHAPPVLVLDEPTAGVDVDLRQSLWAHVRELNRAGTTVVLTTHYLEEAQELCDTIAIVNHGLVVAADSKDALLARMDRKELVVTLNVDTPVLPEALRGLDATLKGPRKLVIGYQPSRTQVGDLLGVLSASGLTIRDLSIIESNLEDLFLQLTRSPEASAAAALSAAAAG
jgi:ABC-2 type transport system ATP-binding protein